MKNMLPNSSLAFRPTIHGGFAGILAAALVSCAASGEGQAEKESGEPLALAEISPIDREPFEIAEIATLKEPWAMAFMPGRDLLFVTEKKGGIKFVDPASGTVGDVTGDLPEVDYGGQGGMGDIVFAPDFAESGHVYLSWAEAGDDDTRGAVVGRGKLTCDDAAESCNLSGLKVIWQQQPKVTGRGHYGHRIAFSPDGKYLFISSGERQKFDPAQDMASSMGKILRLNPDGSVPKDNPFYDEEDALPEIWSLGHRNPLGLAFDSEGRLWNHEMGPKGGDELNLVKRASNYGYPTASNGDHYDGKPIPDHSEEDDFEAPKISWTPVISPAGLIQYTGDMFPEWQGSLLIGGLSSRALIRVTISGEAAQEAERFDMGERIREVEQGPNGAIWLLEDGKKGRLLKLTAPKD